MTSTKAVTTEHEKGYFCDDVHIEGNLYVKGSISFQGADQKFKELDSIDATLPFQIQGTTQLTLSATALYPPAATVSLGTDSATLAFGGLRLTNGTAKGGAIYAANVLRLGSVTAHDVALMRNNAALITFGAATITPTALMALGTDSLAAAFSAAYFSNGTKKLSLTFTGANVPLLTTNAGLSIADSTASGAALNVKVLTEEVTIAVGSGSGGVATAGNLLPAGIVLGVSCRVTQAPGGGATKLAIGDGVNPDVFIDDMTVALGDTAVYPANGDGTAGVVCNKTAGTLTLTTDGDVTVTAMKARVVVYYLDSTGPTA